MTCEGHAKGGTWCGGKVSLEKEVLGGRQVKVS